MELKVPFGIVVRVGNWLGQAFYLFKRHNKFVLSLIFIGLVLSFQNCSSNFSVTDQEIRNLSSLSGDPDPEDPKDPEEPKEEDPPPELPPDDLPDSSLDYRTQPFNAPFAVVYVRIPRSTAKVDYIDEKDVLHPGTGNWDVMQTLPETSHRISKMSGPGQLIYRDREGREKILFDCMTSMDCLPMDPTVSFDGKKVIFSVLKGEFKNLVYKGVVLPVNRMQTSKEAQLVVADLATGQLTYLAHVPGAFDTGPVFLPDGKIMFTSTRSQELTSSHFFYTPDAEKALQLWIADADGNNAVRVGPHDRDGVLHPFVMTDGQVLFTTWQFSHLQAHRSNNGSVGGPSALNNKFWLASVDHTGGNWNAVLGRHGYGYKDGSGSLKLFKALHFVTETTSGWLCSTDYYRGNNFGAGTIVCWFREATGIEGKGPSETNSSYFIFTPRKMFGIAPWTGSQDDVAEKVNGRYLGKIRDPMALPGNQLLLTHLDGACSKIQERFTVLKIQDQPIGCDAGIFMTTKIPSQSPNDLVKIVDRPEWHEFMGRVAEPYSFIYGKAKPDTPAVKRDTSNRCIIASSSMEAEVDAVEPYKFFSAKDCAIQGCKARAKSIGDVKAIRFWQVLPNTDWKVQLAKLRSNTGNRLKLLGDVPLNADGSFAAEIPCETPYVMAGVDSDGNTLMRDQTPQSLRKGEIRTCTGCHLHSKPGRPLNQSDAFKQLNNPFQVGINNFPTIQKGKVVAQTTNVPAMVDYAKDVYPILERRCNSCHAGDQAAGGLRLDIPGSALFSAANPSASSTWYRIAWDFRQSLVPNKISYDPVNPNNFSLEKPNSSKYMNAVFAVESLFLWKILNQRVDGRTDSTYAKDVDFGSNHPVSISDDEIRTIRDWIDSGAYSSQP